MVRSRVVGSLRGAAPRLSKYLQFFTVQFSKPCSASAIRHSQFSQHCDQATGWTRAEQWLVSRDSYKIFLFSEASRPTLGPTYPLEGKAEGTKAVHSPSSGAEVQEKVEYTSTEICAFMARSCRCAMAICQDSRRTPTGSQFTEKRCWRQQSHSRRPFTKIIKPSRMDLLLLPSNVQQAPVQQRNAESGPHKDLCTAIVSLNLCFKASR